MKNYYIISICLLFLSPVYAQISPLGTCTEDVIRPILEKISFTCRGEDKKQEREDIEMVLDHGGFYDRNKIRFVKSKEECTKLVATYIRNKNSDICSDVAPEFSKPFFKDEELSRLMNSSPVSSGDLFKEVLGQAVVCNQHGRAPLTKEEIVSGLPALEVEKLNKIVSGSANPKKEIANWIKNNWEINFQKNANFAKPDTLDLGCSKNDSILAFLASEGCVTKIQQNLKILGAGGCKQEFCYMTYSCSDGPEKVVMCGNRCDGDIAKCIADQSIRGDEEINKSKTSPVQINQVKSH